MPHNGAFTLPRPTKTNTDNKYREPNGNLCCHWSLYNKNTSTKSYPIHFLSVSVSVSVSDSVNTPKLFNKTLHKDTLLLFAGVAVGNLNPSSTWGFFFGRLGTI